MTVEQLHVLLVEDQESNINAWHDKASSHNSDAEKKGFAVETTVAKSVSEARALLQSRKSDAVVVDLRLLADGSAEPNDHGNALVKYVCDSHPVAVAIYSGQSGEAEVEPGSQIQVFDRGDGLNPVFAWLEKQLNMLIHLRSTKVAMERETARVFFRSIWPRWEHWSKGKNGNLHSILARHVVAHIHDALLDADGGNAHPEESFFFPPIKDRLDTGDLIRDGDSIWVVVTPRCDLANANKVATVVVARCEDIAVRWSKSADRKRLAQHEGSPKQHFLPPMIGADGKPMGPWYVQFHDLRAVEISKVEVDLKSKRWASLAPQFVPSLVERFGAYFSRIGTPNLSSE